MEKTNRTLRFEGRQALRSVTSNPRCKDCGYVSMLAGGNVGVRRTSAGVVGLAGLATCGAGWLCPVCNAKIMTARGVEIGAMLSWAEASGFHVLWGSLTSHHTTRSRLDGLLSVQLAAWRRVVSSKWWKNANAVDAVPHECVDKCVELSGFDEATGELVACSRVNDYRLSTRSGRVGYVRAAEVTVGAKGWHPHFHPVVIFQGTPDEAKAYALTLTAKWVAMVNKLGGRAGTVGAQSIEVISHGEGYRKLAGYVTKASYEPAKLALEIVWSQSKNGRRRAWDDVEDKMEDGSTVRRIGRTVSHWSLLAEAGAGVEDAVVKWREFEKAISGRRVVTWSRGLRQLAGLTDLEVADFDIAAAVVGVQEDTVCMITGRGWRVARQSATLVGLILDTLHASGWVGLRPLLDAYGVEWVSLEELARQDSDVNFSFAAEKWEEERAAYWAGRDVMM